MNISEREFENITEKVRTGRRGGRACEPGAFSRPLGVGPSPLVEILQAASVVRETIFILERGRVRCEPARSESAALGQP
ncbi:hypothetical protein [Deinococcus sp. UYEF24]